MVALLAGKGLGPVLSRRVGGGWESVESEESMTTATAPTEEPEVVSTAPMAEPGTPAAAPGPLARILTPVEPARPARSLGTTAAMNQGVEAASSSSGSTEQPSTAKGAGRGSVVAALGHALAERLRRGGTSIKRTHDIKETRVSGATSTATHANRAEQLGKNERLAKHDGQHRTNRDNKLADLNNKVDQRHGRTGSDVKKADTTKADSTRGATSTTASRRDAGPFGAKAAKRADAGERPTKGTAPAKTADDTKSDPTGGPAGAATAKPTDPKGLNAKTKATAKRAGATADEPRNDDPKKTAAPTGTTAPTVNSSASAAPKLRTRTAREAGYRDGTRVAGTVGQARAYRDGARDGWDDRTAADKAEGKTMSDTRARNATRPQQKTAAAMKPTSGSTVDLAKKQAPAAMPVQVTAVDAKAVGFTGSDGASHTMSRGEVRTLKGFERRLAEKQVALAKIAEGSKDTRVHAVDLATRAQRLSENAKNVKGGAGIVALLARLAERAQLLRARAEEIERRAHRGSEAVRALAANAETRHGGIYKAVVDSPLTAPAEREFYADKQGS